MEAVCSSETSVNYQIKKLRMKYEAEEKDVSL
jgi:hypothetical protein